MNLQRPSHPGAGLTTAVVLLCGIISGAAMAAGNRQAAPQNAVAHVEAVPTPSVPTVPGVNTVPSPEAVTSREVTQVANVSTLRSHAEVPEAADAPMKLDDVLVLRRETTYTPKKEATQPEAPEAHAADDTPVLATSKPFAGMNFTGLGLFMMALLGGAGLLAYRKKQEDLAQGNDLTLEVASTIRVGAKWQISLIRVPGRILVVGATERGLELLTELYPEGDEEAMEELLDQAQTLPSQAIQHPGNLPVLTKPSRLAEDSPADVFDPLADISPRYDDTRSAGTYARQPRRPSTTPAREPLGSSTSSDAAQGHDDAFLDAVLDRLSKARPAVIRHTTKPAPRVDERAALRAQVKQYRRGPTRL